MAADQGNSQKLDQPTAKSVLNIAFGQHKQLLTDEPRKALRYATAAYYLDKTKRELGLSITRRGIRGLLEAENDQLHGSMYYDDIEGGDELKKRCDKDADNCRRGVAYLEREKNTHSLDDLMRDCSKLEGIAREVYIDEMCRELTDFCNSVVLLKEVVEREIGAQDCGVKDCLIHMVNEIIEKSSKATANLSEAYIHLDHPGRRLERYAETSTIPESAILLMIADQIVEEVGY